MKRLDDGEKQRCTHVVRVSRVETFNREIMHSRRSRQGVADNVCGMRAAFTHDEKALCRSHAGHVALMMMLDDPEAFEG